MVPSNSTRDRVALWVIVLSIGGIVVAASIAIWQSTDQTRPEMSRLVFSSVLPLLGTWVGTVVAFYFARENLQAATDSVGRLASRFSATTPVLQAMIPKGRIAAATAADSAAANALLLSDLLAAMTAGQRIPIFDPQGAVLYVVHKSTIDSYRAKLAAPGDFAPKTLSDLIATPDLKAAVEAIATVGPNSLLSDARSAMISIPNCNDVFVTTDGQRQSPVLGWLTNTLLAGVQ